MRRLPASWTSTLTRLGFRHRKKRSSDFYARRSRIELLEERQLLAFSVSADLYDSSLEIVGAGTERDRLFETAPIEYRVGHFELTSDDWTGKESGKGLRRDSSGTGVDSGLPATDPGKFDPGETWSFRFDRPGFLMGIQFDEYTVDDADRAILVIGGRAPIEIDAKRLVRGFWRPSEQLQFEAGESIELRALAPTAKMLDDALAEQLKELDGLDEAPKSPTSAWKVMGVQIIGRDSNTFGGYVDLTKQTPSEITLRQIPTTGDIGSLAVLEGVDVNVQGFGSNGGSHFWVSYTLSQDVTEAFPIEVHRSVDGSPSPNTVLQSYSVPNIGMNWKAGAVRTVWFAVADFSDTTEDYYLVAHVDDDTPSNNTKAFGGGLFQTPSGIVHYHGPLSSANDNVYTYTSNNDGYGRVNINNGQGIYEFEGGFPEIHVRTHGGNDTITLDDNDQLGIKLWAFGGAGLDNIYGDHEADYLDGGSDSDTIYGNGGDDEIYGGTGGPDASGYGYGNYLFGNAGNDVIHGDYDPDWIDGGDNTDQIYGGDESPVTPSVTWDQYGNGGGGYWDGGGGDYILGGLGDDDVEGEGGNDYIDGGGDGDILDGGLDNDYLLGSSGNDLLRAGGGVDILNGAANDDTYMVANVVDATITILDNGGTNDQISFAEWDLGAAKGKGAQLVLDYFRQQSVTKPGNDNLVLVEIPLGVQIESLVGTGQGLSDTFVLLDQPMTVMSPADGLYRLPADPAFNLDELTLREALTVNARRPGTDTIEFASGLNGQTIFLEPSRGQLVITTDNMIIGPGADKLTIDAQNNSRVFNIAGGMIVTISGLKITRGRVTGTIDGGGIYTDGNLTLDSVVVFDNDAGDMGGGIYISSQGSLELINSTVDQNTATHGGGIFGHFATGDKLYVSGSTISNNTAIDTGGGLNFYSVAAGGQTSGTIINSTISGNEVTGAFGRGGGIHIESYTPNYVDVDLVGSTITGNRASLGGGVVSAIDYITTEAHNTIIAGNKNLNEVDDDLFGSGFESTSSNNLIGINWDNSVPTGNGNIILNGQDPGLAPLDFYGGTTKTHALRLNSPAINKGDNSLLPPGTTNDQRGNGFARIYGDKVDIGAFEALAAVSLAGTGTATVGIPYSLRVHLAGALRAPGTTVSINWGDSTTPITGTDLQTLINTGFVTVTHTYTTGLRSFSVTATGAHPGGSGGTPLSVTSAPHEVLVGQQISSNDFSFRETGGSDAGKATAMDVGDPATAIMLTEGDSFLAELSRLTTITSESTHLVFSFSELVFDDSSTTPLINDAFEIALLDTDGRSLVPTIGSGRDAFFNISEHDATRATMATGVTYVSGIVSVDVSQLRPDAGTTVEARLVFRLVNNDEDEGSSVKISTLPATFDLWGTDDNSGSLFRIPNYGSPTASEINYQAVHYDNGVVGAAFPTIKPTGADSNIESFTVSNDGIAYFVANRGVTYDGTPLQSPVLFRLDLNTVDGLYTFDGVNHNWYAQVIGTLDIPNFDQGSNNDNITALVIDPETNDLLALFQDGLGSSSDPNQNPVDQILRVTEAELLAEISDGDPTNGVEYVPVGPISGSATFGTEGQVARTSEDFVFGPDGFLYLVDTNDDHLYRVNTQGFIVEVVDFDLNANLMGPLPSGNSRIEGLAFDPLTGDLIASDDDLNVMTRIEFHSNGTIQKTVIHNIETEFGFQDVEGLAFVTIPATGLALPSPVSDPSPVDFEKLVDVTAGFDIEYQVTSLNDSADVLYANLKLTNNGIFDVRDTLLIGAQGFDGLTRLFEPDGVTPDGIAFFNISRLAFADGQTFNTAGDSVEGIELRFLNTEGNQFNYDLVILGALNRAPTFTNEPFFAEPAGRAVEVAAGNEFTHDANALEPDGDDYHFSFVLRPSGLMFDNPLLGGQTSADGKMSWIPSAADVGKSYPVRLRVTDEFDAFTEQDFTIRVVSATANRPPYFETPPFPVTEAFVNEFPGIDPFDLASWQAVDLTSDDLLADTVWQVLGGNTSAQTTQYGDGSVFLSDFHLDSAYVRGEITPGTSSVPGAFGLVFGYQDEGHYYLLEWTGLDPTTGDPGIVVMKVDSDTPLSFNDLVATDGVPGRVEQLFHSDVLIQTGTTYTFELIHLEDEFTIAITNDSGELVESVTIHDDTYRGGQFGFFSFLRENVTFANFSSRELGPKPYIYDSLARDLDGDQLRYSLVEAPYGMLIDRHTGRMVWSAPASLVDQLVHVRVKVEDLNPNGTPRDPLSFDLQEFDIAVYPDPMNGPPEIISPPITEHDLPGLPQSPTGNVSGPINLNLGLGEMFTDTVTITLTQEQIDELGSGFQPRQDGESGELNIFINDGESGPAANEFVSDNTLRDYLFGTGTTGIDLSSIAITRNGALQSETGGTPAASTVGVFVDEGSGTYGLDEFGIVFSTGNVMDYESANLTLQGSADENFVDLFYGVTNKQTDWGDNSTSDENFYLHQISGSSFSYHDVTQIDIDFQLNPGFSEISFNLVIGSEEYSDFVNTDRIDAFGIFLTKRDVDGNPIETTNETLIPAFGPPLGHPTRINGSPPIYDGSVGVGDLLGDLPINVDHPQFDNVPGTELDGVLTQDGGPKVTRTIFVGDGGRGTLTFIIADTGDGVWDTTAFISGLGATNPNLPDVTIIAPVAPPEFFDNGGVIRTDVPANVLQEFPVKFTGDGFAHSFDLQFVDANNPSHLFGTIPVTVNSDYFYLVEAIDPDVDDKLVFSLPIKPEGPFAPEIDPDTGEIHWDPIAYGATPGSMYDFVVRVDDGHGHHDEQAFTVTVDEFDTNSGPQLSGNPPGQVFVGDEYYYVFNATDPDNTDPEAHVDRLRYYLSTFSDGMEIDPITGEFRWTPTELQVGPHNVTVKVFDGHQGSVEFPFQIEVLLPDVVSNRKPQFIGPAPQESVTVGDLFEYHVMVEDLDGHEYTVEPVFLPEGMAYHRTSRTITWRPTENQIGPHTFVLRASDGRPNGATTKSFDINVVRPNVAPVFLTDPELDQIRTYATQPYFIPIQAYDPFDPTSQGIQPVDFLYDSADLPTGMSFVEVGEAGPNLGFTLLITGIPSETGPFPIDITVRDASDAETPRTFMLEVLGAPEPGPNVAPTVNPPRNQIAVGQKFTWKIEPEDENGDPVSFSLSYPGQMDFDEQSRTLTWTPTVNDVLPPGESYAIEITLDDNRGEANSVVELPFPLTVTGHAVNDAPIITEKQYKGAVVGVLYDITFEATDPNNDGVSWVLVEKPDDTFHLNPETGQLTWLPEARHLTSQTIIVQAVDDHGKGSALLELTIPVRGTNTPPGFGHFNPPTVVGVNSEYEYQVIASDTDGGPNPLTYILTSNNVPIDSVQIGGITIGDWLQIDPETGLITSDGTVLGQTPSIPMSVPLEIVISDGISGKKLPFTLEVVDDPTATNKPPVMEPVTVYDAFAGQTDYELHFHVEDPEDDDLTVAIDAASESLGFTLIDLDNGDYVVHWDTTIADPPLTPGQSYPLKVTVTDGPAGSNQTLELSPNIFLQPNPDNDPPVFIDFDPPRVWGTGTLFEFQVNANDPDNGPQPLTYELVDPPNWLRITSSGLITSAGTSGNGGLTPSTATTVAVNVQISDGAFVVGRTFTLDVVANPGAINQPPGFVPVAVPDGFEGQTDYEITFGVSDPEGNSTDVTLDPISMGFGFDLISLGSNQYRVTWDITGTPGLMPDETYALILHATDVDTGSGASGLTTTADVDVPLRPNPAIGNTAPRFVDPMVPDQEISPGATFTGRVYAVDDDASNIKLYYELVNPPAGEDIKVDGTGLVTWNVSANYPLGPVPITVQVRDDFGVPAASPQTFNVTVTPDDENPTVSVAVLEPVGPIGSKFYFAVVATDNAGILEVRLVLRPQSGGPDRFVSLFKDPAQPTRYTGSIQLDVADTYDAIATAVDTAQPTKLTAMDSLEVIVFDPAAVISPTVSISGIENFAELTDPNDDEQNEFTFTVGFPTGEDPSAVQWRVELLDTSGFKIPLDSGVGVVTDRQVTIPITAVPNGYYELRVTASNGVLAPVRDSRSIFIDTVGVKVGDFGLSFTDLSIPVGGIPLTISRTYDTKLVGADSEFGPGWQMEFRDAHLSTVGLIPGEESLLFPNSTDGFTIADQVSGIPGTRVYITLPGGKREAFEFTPILEGNIIGQAFGYPAFTPIQGTTSQLEVDPAYLSVFEGLLVDDQGRLYNPLNSGGVYYVTTQDGFRYTIDAESGLFTEIRDPFGNRLELTNTSATTYDSDDNDLARVTFRKQGDRIVEIIDPNGKSIHYGYDPLTRDLISVTDRSGITTGYEYNVVENEMGVDEQIGRPHFLTRIVDNRSVRVLQASFDEFGRLSGLKDASGNSAGFTYVLDGESVGLPSGFVVETITDANDVPTEVIRDTRGNVVGRITHLGDDGDPANGIEDVYQISYFTYDSNDNQTGVGRPIQVDELAQGDGVRFTTLADTLSLVVVDPDAMGFDPSLWQSFQTFDDRGNVTLRIDGEGNRTEFRDYDALGNPGLTIDPTGTVTTSSYDGGLLKQSVVDIVDGPDSITDYDYDPSGNLAKIERTLENGTKVTTGEFTYGDAGRLESSTSSRTDEHPNGITQYFRYDENGNQTVSFSHWDDPATGNGIQGDGVPDVLVVNRSEYDEEGRVTTTSQYTFDPIPAAFLDPTGLFSADQLDSGGYTADWSTETVYNLAGQVWKTIDRFGNTTENRYDTRGNLVETRTEATTSGDLAVWVVTRTAYDKNGRVLATTDPFLLAADANEDYVDPTTEQPYTSGGVPDFLRVSHTIYDELGRVVESRRLTGLEIEITPDDTYGDTVYDANFDANYDQVANWEDDLLSRATTQYDAQGRIFKSTAYDTTGDPLNDILVETFYEYDNASRQTATVQTFDADGDGMIDAADDPGDADLIPDSGTEFFRTESQYDAGGRQDVTIDALGRQTKFIFDGLGRVTKTVGDFGGLNVTTETKYDALGRRIAEIDALGRETNYAYDDAGRLTLVTLPAVDNLAGGQTRPTYEYKYDAFGNQIEIKDPLGHVTRFTYDHLGRQISRTLPLGVESTGDDTDFVERMFYDDTALEDMILPLNESVGLGQLAFSVDFEGNVTEYLYDNTATGGGRPVTKRFYKQLGLAVPPSTDLDTFRAMLGSPVAESNVSYTYDALGRQTVVADSAHGATTTKYDADGRVTQIDSPEGILNYQFDNLGRLTSTDTTGSTPITETEYSYDALGRLKTVQALRREGTAVSEAPTEYTYDKVGNLDEVKLPNGVISDYVYDSLNRLDLLTHFLDDGIVNGQYDDGQDTLLGQYDYEVRQDGKRTSVLETDDQGNTTRIDWIYDALGRLTGEAYDFTHATDPNLNDDFDYIAQYRYDLASNRKEHNVDRQPTPQAFANFRNDQAFPGGFDEETEYDYDSNDRLLTEVVNKPSTADDRYTVYSYGPSNGQTNQTGRTEHQGLSDQGTIRKQTTFTYNSRGRMESTRNQTFDASGVEISDVTTSYEYNDRGIRVSQTVDDGTGQVTTVYHIDPNNHTGYTQVLEEGTDTSGDGELQAGEIAKTYTIGHDVIAQAAATATYLSLYDGHGSTRALLNAATSAIVQRYAYDAFGNLLTGVNLTALVDALTSLLYSGQQTDRTGLQYLRARYYDPRTGRFNRFDPYAGNIDDPQSLHKYLYTLGDPVNGVDPSGEFLLTITALLLGLPWYVLLTGLVADIGVIAFTLQGLTRGPQANSLQSQLPSNLATTSVLYHSAEFSGGTWSANRMFSEVSGLTNLPASEIISYVPPRAVGDIATFSITNWQRVGQRDFSVRVVRFDPAQRIMVVETLDGHPLQGWRTWQVSRLPNGNLLVETWSIDEPFARRDDVKFILGGDSGQKAIWTGMLRNLEKKSGSTIIRGNVQGTRYPTGQLGNFYNRLGI